MAVARARSGQSEGARAERAGNLRVRSGQAPARPTGAGRAGGKAAGEGTEGNIGPRPVMPVGVTASAREERGAGKGSESGTLRVRSGQVPGRPTGQKRGGPRTAAGKARSARNAWKHGLRARKILVGEEAAQDYAGFRERMFRQWAPRDETECFLVHRMAGVAWRLLRCPEIEAELLETLRDGEAPGGGLARAFLVDDAADGGAPVRFARYETALERSYFRCLRMLRLMRMATGAAQDPPGEPGKAGTPRLGSGQAPGRPTGAGRVGREEAGAAELAGLWREGAERAQGIALDWLDDDDEPVEVEEVILDEERAGAETDGRGGPEWIAAGAAPVRAPRGTGAEDVATSGQERPEADKFPNELPAGPHPVRDWPGEPGYRPLAQREPEPSEVLEARKPGSRVIDGAVSRVAGQWLD